MDVCGNGMESLTRGSAICRRDGDEEQGEILTFFIVSDCEYDSRRLLQEESEFIWSLVLSERLRCCRKGILRSQ